MTAKPMPTPPFAAAQVREMAGYVEVRHSIKGYDVDVRIAAMLDAFAARLEQDEQRVSVRFLKEYAITTDKMPSRMDLYGPFPQEHWDAVREEGRREILREIANSVHDDPRLEIEASIPRYECFFCGLGDEQPHKPTCLWLRAQEATQEPVKP